MNERLLTPEEIKQIEEYWFSASIKGRPDPEILIAQAQDTKTTEIVRAEERKALGRGKDTPGIICLCGSTRFVDTFNEWRQKLTLEGKIVVSIELVLPQSEREDPQHSNYKVKQMLDELHLRKVDIADEVMILNVGGYIGESTRNEIAYATSKGKPIKYLVALKEGKGVE